MQANFAKKMIISQLGNVLNGKRNLKKLLLNYTNKLSRKQSELDLKTSSAQSKKKIMKIKRKNKTQLKIPQTLQSIQDPASKRFVLNFTIVFVCFVFFFAFYYYTISVGFAYCVAVVR